MRVNNLIRTLIIIFIEQKQMMYDYDPRSSPCKDSRNGNGLNPSLLLDLKHEAASSLAADRTAPSRKQPDEYEDQWQINFLHHIAREMYDSDYEFKNHSKQRYGDYDDGRRKQFENKTHKNRKKELSKYKAYAVKMKIPSYHELVKPRIREGRSGETLEFQNHLSQIRGMYDPCSKMEEIYRVNARDIAIANIFESSNGNIFKKRPVKSSKNTNIRKRSIKTSDKRKEEDQEVKISLNKFLKTSTSPKITKKGVISLDQSTLDPCLASQIKDAIKQPTSQLKKIQNDRSRKAIGCAMTSKKSPQKEKQKDSREAFMGKQVRDVSDSTSKLLEKVDRAIHFKKKDQKEESPAKKTVKQLSPLKTITRDGQQSSEKHDRLREGGDLGQATSKTVMRTIYTSKDVIRNKSNLLKESPSKDENRRDSTVQKVFIFNSEDNYIRRLLVKAGWIHNHDYRSHFYHLKWVFKPDAIDYNLKSTQFVNHVKNSHQLTSKHYLNKNLKAYLSCWPALYSVYPHSYDFSKPAQKQEFYAHFKKEIMMVLLQKVYEYMLYMRPLKVQKWTRFYESLLQEDNTYNNDEIGESPLRKKIFRKIDMEDYKQYDNAFLIHMNLLTVALKYWRGIRKIQQLEEDEEPHFLMFREKEFEDNLQYLQKYSKMSISYSSSNIEQYFERELFATPSDIAIERVIKEYVYFQRQLGRQWRIFGRGNIWIVKPCSASRGTGIYLANDCAQILTDTRGIQSKIVQRYIQRPLILRHDRLRGKKFDLRQWVLLRSVQPLEVYMFSHCYLRICSEDFDIHNISNLKAHLTNYSFNKRHFQQPAESVIDQDTFQNILLEERNVNFIENIRPKIKEIVIRSIKSTQHLVSDCSQSCFSLLGYDILIDGDCEPWLLQVNMSPACEERTEWLRSYLDVMGRELLKIVLPENYVCNAMSPSNRASELPAKKQWGQPQWELDHQLKKIKTEASQIDAANDGKEVNSYVDAVFDLNHSKLQRNSNENKEEVDEQSNSSEQYGHQITCEDFMIENQFEKEQSQGWQQVKIQNMEYQGKGHSPHKSDLSPIKKEKFQFMEIYLNETQGKQFVASPKKYQSPSPHSKISSLSPNKLKDSEISLIELQGKLKWQQICYEQYSGTRKDADMHLDLAGIKITNQNIIEIDKIINNVEAQNKYVVQSCVYLQNCIRKYLELKRNFKKQSLEKIGLKLNVTKLEKTEFRESKSALYNHEQKSWHFDKYGREGINSRNDRPTTARNGSNPASAKNRGSDSFREKIRSIAMQAASRQGNKQVDSGQVRQRVTEEEKCSSRASLEQMQSHN